MSEGRTLLDATSVQRCLRRMANEIVEKSPRDVPLALVGIRKGGVALARRLAVLIAGLEGREPEVGAVDITLYRDDLYTGLERPTLGETELPFDLEASGILLVDDVLFTGRTVRAALDAVHDYGRPRYIKLAVLVDRGHRELPIQADFVGKKVETALFDRITVVASELPSPTDHVMIEPRRPA